MGQTILHREIGYRRFFLILRFVHIGAENRIDVVEFLHELLVLGEFHHAVVTDGVQQDDGVRTGLMPSVEVNVTEQILRVSVPTPPHIVRDLLQFAQLGRKGSVYVALFPLRLIHITYFYIHNYIVF